MKEKSKNRTLIKDSWATNRETISWPHNVSSVPSLTCTRHSLTWAYSAFCFISLECYVRRYDLKSEFLTLDEMWPCCHWQEPHRGNVCEVLALRHPRHISDLLMACNEAGNEIHDSYIPRLSFPNTIKVVTGKGTRNLNFLITHASGTLLKAFRPSLQNLPIRL